MFFRPSHFVSVSSPLHVPGVIRDGYSRTFRPPPPSDMRAHLLSAARCSTSLARPRSFPSFFRGIHFLSLPSSDFPDRVHTPRRFIGLMADIPGICITHGVAPPAPSASPWSANSPSLLPPEAVSLEYANRAPRDVATYQMPEGVSTI